MLLGTHNVDAVSLFWYIIAGRIWANSSVGRASALQAEGPGFESLLVHHKTPSQDGVLCYLRNFGDGHIGWQLIQRLTVILVQKIVADAVASALVDGDAVNFVFPEDDLRLF